MSASVVGKLITGNESEFCYLCLGDNGAQAIRIQDEIIVDKAEPLDTVQMTELLTFLLGEQQASHLSPMDFICGSCTATVRNCYQFIKNCQKNIEFLTKTLDALSDCTQNTSNVKFNTLFISVNTNNFTSKQLYDRKKILQTKSSALMRFRTLNQSTEKSQDKKPRKLRKHSNNLLKICDVIREINTPTKYRCKVCSNTFSKTFNFKKHFYSQHSPKILKCADCDKSFGSDALLKQHRYECHCNVLCSECGKTYNNRYSLLYHMRRHTGDLPYQCQFCDSKFRWASHRAEHVRRYHMEPVIECDICHVKFKTLGSLYEHRKRHFNPNSRLHVSLEQTEEVIEEGVVGVDIL